jgi:hypothetical protein
MPISSILVALHAEPHLPIGPLRWPDYTTPQAAWQRGRRNGLAQRFGEGLGLDMGVIEKPGGTARGMTGQEGG